MACETHRLPIVEPHRYAREREHTEDRQHNAPDRYLDCRAVLAHHPSEQQNYRGQTYEQALVRPAVCQNCQAHTQQQRIAHARPSDDPPQRAKNESAADDRYGPTPIALTPMEQNDRVHHRE
jgi:hypothetical protein